MSDGTCRVCGASVLWARTNKGRPMPVDPEPRPDGNLAIYRDHLGKLRARVVTSEQPIESWERPGMPHAATCVPPKSEPIGRTRDGAISLADARRRRSNTNRKAAR